MQAIAALLKTGHREPQIPKEARLTTGKPMWYVAPMRPVRQTKHAAIVYPIQTQSHDCHQDRPATTMELEIIHVFMLKESAIQKPTKFQAPHCRRSGSTGFRSRLVSMSWAVVRPGSLSTASLSPHRLRRAPLAWAMAVLQGLQSWPGNVDVRGNKPFGGATGPGC